MSAVLFVVITSNPEPDREMTTDDAVRFTCIVCFRWIEISDAGAGHGGDTAQFPIVDHNILAYDSSVYDFVTRGDGFGFIKAQHLHPLQRTLVVQKFWP